MMRPKIIVLALFSLFPILFTACAADSTSYDAAAPELPTQVVVVRETPTAVETPAPVPTPADLDAFLGQFNHALSASEPTELSSLLLDAVWVGAAADPTTGESYSLDSGTEWLKGHWSSGLEVDKVDYVRDAALLEISTTGWSPTAPLESGTLVFHLHRYGSGGQEDDLGGSWRIDTILY